MSVILAIDPGPTDSAYAVIDHQTRRPCRFGKTDNTRLRDLLRAAAFDDCHHTAIEMVASYGMPVGAEVFETCVWIGRFMEQAILRHAGPIDLVYRQPVKLHHCGSARAKDSNITQALVDRFANGASNHGKGTKAAPGWFYGFKADIWQAYALAVYIADTTPVSAPVSVPVVPTPVTTGTDHTSDAPPMQGEGRPGRPTPHPGGVLF